MESSRQDRHSQQPNILIWCQEDTRNDILGFRGETPCRTPNMDRLAAEGISFDQAVTPSPLCTPARASLFTGAYPHKAGLSYNPHDPVDPRFSSPGSHDLQMPSFTSELRRKGYQCFHAGKVHLGTQDPATMFDAFAATAGGTDYAQWCVEKGIPDGRNFDPDIEDSPYRSHRSPYMTMPRPGLSKVPEGMDWDSWIVNNALELLRKRDKNRPFVLSCCPMGVHPPFVVHPEYYNMYDPEEIPEPANFHPGPGEPKCLEQSYYRLLHNDWGTNWDAWRKSVAVYWGYATFMDQLLGKLTGQLEAEGILDNTLVIATADHGEMLGQHGLWHKMCPYEEAVKIPLIMRLPGVINAGARWAGPVSLVDIAPTALAAAALSVPTDYDGINLLNRTAKQSKLSDRAVFSQYTVHPEWTWHKVKDWRMIIRGAWKYVYHHNDRAELYNLQNDPVEMINRAEDADTHKVVTDLRRELFEWMKSGRDSLMQAGV